MIKCKFNNNDEAYIEDFKWTSDNKNLENYLNDGREFGFKLPQYANPDLMEATHKTNLLNGKIVEDDTKDYKREDDKIY